MDRAFWFARWTEGRIGFHEGAPNAFLSRHADWLAGCQRILVPLCGKAEDLAYLAGLGHEVVGIELVEDAVRQFFAEHGATPTITAAEGFAIYRAGPITVLAGDFFATSPALVGAIDGVYDRTAMVALPPEMRGRYVAHVKTLARAARELLVTIEYTPGTMNGPPFSVAEAEVREHFTGLAVNLVDTAADPLGRAGGTWVDRCYQIALA